MKVTQPLRTGKPRLKQLIVDDFLLKLYRLPAFVVQLPIIVVVLDFLLKDYNF